MLPKKERLSREDFSRFFSSGKRRNSPALGLVYTPYPSLHVSVVVPKKVARRAVDRNVMRRRIYDIVRRHRDEVGATGVFIFLAKAPALRMPFGALRDEVIGLITAACGR
ncbi:MAG TPA: ribonuclease P protein component [Candidatus Paceibacterota bacterium]|nr:ribonuclease P protein component [Candidatus Paceibacterota bacterium]